MLTLLNSTRQFIAPHLLLSPEQLVSLASSEGATITHLEVTLYVSVIDVELSDVKSQLDKLFKALSPTRHLHLRLVFEGLTGQSQISDHIYRCINTLPHLTSLGIGGDISLGQDQHDGRRAVCEHQLAHLPLIELQLLLSEYPPFVIHHSGDTILSYLGENDPESFKDLRKLTVEYGDEVNDCIPVGLPQVCRKSGIELTLRKTSID